MGNEYGDAQNAAVRVLLNQFSKRFDTFFDGGDWRKRTIEYFEGCCPYSGVPLEGVPTARDHVVPLNREHCGLHLYGNVLVVSHSANTRKHNKSLEQFLGNEPQRLKRVQAFIRESGFPDIYGEHKKTLRKTCAALYGQVRDLVEGHVERFSCPAPRAPERVDDVVPIQVPLVVSASRVQSPELALRGGDEMDAKEKAEVERRLRLWASSPHQKSHTAMAILVRLLQEGRAIDRALWTRVVRSVVGSTNPAGFVASLATTQGNNYGRVTRFVGERVELHPAVRDVALSLSWRLQEADWQRVSRLL